METALETLKLHKLVLLKADDTDVLVMCLAESETTGQYLNRGRKTVNGRVIPIKDRAYGSQAKLTRTPWVLWLQLHLSIFLSPILHRSDEELGTFFRRSGNLQR